MHKNIKKNHVDAILKALYLFCSAKEDANIFEYAYLKAPDAFEQLIENAKKINYYPFEDEANIIQQQSSKIKKFLQDTHGVVDLGSGPAYSICNKTLPFLTYVTHLTHYLAIDINQKYLQDAQNIIHQKLPNLKIEILQFNFLNTSKNGHQVLNEKNKKRTYLFLGSTLSNFKEKQQHLILQNIYHMMQYGEILWVGLDTTQNNKIIMQAYNNDYFLYMLQSALAYFCDQYPSIKQSLENLKPLVTYDKLYLRVNLLYEATKDFSIQLPGYETIVISKGCQLTGGSFQKYKTEDATFLLSKHFKILDALNLSNKMRIFICKKIK